MISAAELSQLGVSELNQALSVALPSFNFPRPGLADGTDTINSVPCYKVKITSKEGSESVCYFDSKTYYLVKQDVKAKVQDEEQEMSLTFSNFKKQPEGIIIPMTYGTPQGDITFKTVEINKKIDEKLFTPETK